MKDFEGSCRGKRVETIRMSDNVLVVVFEDGTGLEFLDAGQSCCENRFMVCDEDLASFTGDRYLGFSVDGVDHSAEDTYEGAHEVDFLRIKFQSGAVLVAETHNEHNGYYGGFHVVAREMTS